MTGALCRSCQAEIRWITTEAGRQAPVDARPEKRFIIEDRLAGEVGRLVDAYVSHFATCPDADQHRTR